MLTVVDSINTLVLPQVRTILLTDHLQPSIITSLGKIVAVPTSQSWYKSKPGAIEGLVCVRRQLVHNKMLS